MNYRLLLGIVTLAVLLPTFAYADTRTLGQFSSEVGLLRFELSDGSASSAGEIRVQLEADSRKHIWSTIYSMKSDYVIYAFPLTPDDSSFLIEENLGSGYRTVILRVESAQSVITQLNASGKGFPEVVRTGTEDTLFVVIPNAGKAGDVIDVVDIYAFRDGVFKLQQRGAASQKLSLVQQLSRRIDQAAAERRKGVVVHP